MPSLRQLVNCPCVTCALDTLHIANVCFQCGTSLALTPRQPEDFDPGLTREARTADRARRAMAKARQKRLDSRTKSTTARAQYMREWRIRQKTGA